MEDAAEHEQLLAFQPSRPSPWRRLWGYNCCPWLPARYVLVMMAFLGFFILYALRTNLSIAIVQMANSTASPTSHLVRCSIVASFQATTRNHVVHAVFYSLNTYQSCSSSDGLILNKVLIHNRAAESWSGLLRHANQIFSKRHELNKCKKW